MNLHGARRVGVLVIGAVWLGLAWPQMARAQGFIVDRRPAMPVARSYEIREVSIDARVRDQVAEVQVSQTFHNPGSVQVESEFLFPLPEEGAIQNFVLLVDGRELSGRLMNKDEARRIYEEIVRTKRDPALLEYMGRGLYRTSVFPIPPGADRKVTMRYTQLCRRDRDVIEFSYPLGTQKFTARPSRGWRSTSCSRASERSSRSIAPATTPGSTAWAITKRRSAWNAAISCRPPISGWSTAYATVRLVASVLSYRPSSGGGWLFSDARQPRGEGSRDAIAAQDGDFRARPVGVDGRKEDRAGA